MFCGFVGGSWIPDGGFLGKNVHYHLPWRLGCVRIGPLGVMVDLISSSALMDGGLGKVRTSSESREGFSFD